MSSTSIPGQDVPRPFSPDFSEEVGEAESDKSPKPTDGSPQAVVRTDADERTPISIEAKTLAANIFTPLTSAFVGAMEDAKIAESPEEGELALVDFRAQETRREIGEFFGALANGNVGDTVTVKIPASDGKTFTIKVTENLKNLTEAQAASLAGVQRRNSKAVFWILQIFTLSIYGRFYPEEVALQKADSLMRGTLESYHTLLGQKGEHKDKGRVELAIVTCSLLEIAKEGAPIPHSAANSDATQQQPSIIASALASTLSALYKAEKDPSVRGEYVAVAQIITSEIFRGALTPREKNESQRGYSNRVSHPLFSFLSSLSSDDDPANSLRYFASSKLHGVHGWSLPFYCFFHSEDPSAILDEIDGWSMAEKRVFYGARELSTGSTPLTGVIMYSNADCISRVYAGMKEFLPASESREAVLRLLSSKTDSKEWVDNLGEKRHDGRPSYLVTHGFLEKNRGKLEEILLENGVNLNELSFLPVKGTDPQELCIRSNRIRS
ncbi:MAG: hypothetical protein LBB14_03720 [Puniceicoccales bacterium]|jgi:hypothetical protein|nr:hypothetical protein [Puniceicoccales bacterium]